MPVRTRTLLLCGCLATTALMAPDPSSAATETHNAITSVAAAVTSPDSSTFGRMIAWIFDQQRTLHRELAQDLRNLGSGGGEEAGLGLILASFLYGILHAAGDRKRVVSGKSV